MRILLVGALSWNPERVRSLCERGHALWGVWARSMAWDQGPYPMLADCVTSVSIEDAPRLIADEHIDCVYALFQVYEPSLWGPASPGIEQDVWTLLRRLFEARAAGAFDVPIVFHWGFDVHSFDHDVMRALDGQIFCNRELHRQWTAPVAEGGDGHEIVGPSAVVDFFDSDRPKLEFMTDDFSPRLSAESGEVHTVCIGRPFHIDYVAMARAGIHLHVYGNGYDDAVGIVARGVRASGSGRHAHRIREYVHFHTSRQPTGRSWPEVRDWKSQWVHEFSRYDAGWSYLGRPYHWSPLADAAAIPNRLSTYVLVGLPVISDRRPGLYRYDERVRLGINVDLVHGDYAALRASLDAEARTGDRRRAALSARTAYSFDATIDRLTAFLERSRDAYFARPSAERRRPLPDQPADVRVVVGNRERPSVLRRARAGAARRVRGAQEARIARRLRA
jgi:hypothetical protein